MATVTRQCPRGLTHRDLPFLVTLTHAQTGERREVEMWAITSHLAIRLAEAQANIVPRSFRRGEWPLHWSAVDVAYQVQEKVPDQPGVTVERMVRETVNGACPRCGQLQLGKDTLHPTRHGPRCSGCCP